VTTTGKANLGTLKKEKEIRLIGELDVIVSAKVAK